MKKQICIFLFLVFIIHPVLVRGDYPPHIISYVENNVVNIETVEEEKKNPFYHIVNAFYSRLINWDKYKPFYDQLYKNQKFAKKYPFFIDLTGGLYIAVLKENQKLTDLQPYQHLRGKTVEQVFGYFGDDRLIDTIDGEATRQTVIIQTQSLTEKVTSAYNQLYHEFGHLIHLSLLSEKEFFYLEELYELAGKEDRHFNDYAATNASEYFATALEAYFSVSKPENVWENYTHSRKLLEIIDPRLLAFIESLLDN